VEQRLGHGGAGGLHRPVHRPGAGDPEGGVGARRVGLPPRTRVDPEQGPDYHRPGGVVRRRPVRRAGGGEGPRPHPAPGEALRAARRQHAGWYLRQRGEGGRTQGAAQRRHHSRRQLRPPLRREAEEIRGEEVMPQVISCPKCSQRMQVPDGSTGKQAKCPTCKNVFVIGGAPSAAPQPVGAAAAATAPTPPAAPRAPPPRPPQTPPAPPPPPGAPPPPRRVPPAYKPPLLEGAIASMACGSLLQPDTGAADSDGPPNLCSTPACGVANPPGE